MSKNTKTDKHNLIIRHRQTFKNHGSLLFSFPVYLRGKETDTNIPERPQQLALGQAEASGCGSRGPIAWVVTCC